MDNAPVPKKQKTIHKHTCSHTCDTGLICTRTFREPSELRAHERFVHLGIYDHVCFHLVDRDGATAVFCNQTFERNSDLVRHVKYKHSDKTPFACDLKNADNTTCEYLCKSQDGLNQHKKQAHSELKPYLCEFVKNDKTLCKYACKSQGSLDSHVKYKHSNLKPFACDFKNDDNTTCGHLCKSTGNLTMHKKQVHSELKPYLCEFVKNDKTLCKYACKSQGSLDSHKQRHMEVKIKCPDCNNEYGHSQALAKHHLIKHANQTCPKVIARIEKIRKTTRENSRMRYANDREYRLKCQLSSGVGMWLKRGGKKKGCKSSKLLMMSAAETIIYLEKTSVAGLKYGDPGVEVDHIKPKAAFKRMGPVEQRECWCYLNLQLLERVENRTKSDHFDQTEYDKLDIAKEIAVLRVGWVAEFGETEGPEIIFDENDVGPSNAEGDGAVYDDDASSDSEDECCIVDEDGIYEDILDGMGVVHVQ
jgi:hypothetical protein